MRHLRWGILAAAALAVGACSTHFFPGRCDKTSDCQSMAGYVGYVCDLDPDVQGDGHCVPPCNTTSDCSGGRVCNFDAQHVGRCLFPGDAGVAGGGGGGAGGGASGNGGLGAGGVSGAAGGGGGRDAGQDMNPCNACSGSTPVCLQQTCVECAVSADCTRSAAKPICDPTSHACVPCTSDGQCAAKLGPMGNPGVCRSELDGHCATDAETIYVQNTTGCVATYTLNGPGGTASMPYCSMQPVGLAADATKTLVVVRGTVAAPDWTYQRGQGQPATLFVGQQTGVIASATSPGFNMDSGSAYFRDLKFGPSPSGTVCVEATGGTLNLRNVVIDGCQGGGIYLAGAAFDVEDTIVTNNGPASMGAVQWGGILVTSPSPSGMTILDLVTIENNRQVGLDCAIGVHGTGVLASGNSGLDIASACNVTSCGAASAACGAQ